MIPEISWLEASARYLADYYEQDFLTTLQELTHMMSTMRAPGKGSSWTSFRDHILMMFVDEEWSVEWELTRKVATLVEFFDESHSLAYGHMEEIDLPGVLDTPEPP